MNDHDDQPISPPPLPAWAVEAEYASRHLSKPDPYDPGFCRCGLGLDAWIHTDTTHYKVTPLGRAARTEGEGEGQ